MRKQKTSRPSVLKEVLKAFIPYSRNNLMLSYSPNKFFTELEAKTGSSKRTISSTLSRAKRDNLIFEQDNMIGLTWRGKIKAAYKPTIKNPNGLTLVIFDIPEEQKQDRYLLRCYLKMMNFKLIQKSVWGSEYEASNELKEVLSELNLRKFVVVFDAKQKN